MTIDFQATFTRIFVQTPNDRCIIGPMSGTVTNVPMATGPPNNQPEVKASVSKIVREVPIDREKRFEI